MGLDPLFWMVIISGAVAVFLALLPSFADLRTSENGKVRLTRAGRVALPLAIAGFILSMGAHRISERKDAREKISADSVSHARTEGITRRLEAVLTETETIRGESERLREFQRRALRQVDSVWIVSQELEAHQRVALRDLRLSLALSRGIYDSLRATVGLSRQLADSLRLAEERAAERAQQTLALVSRTSNPLTSIDAAIEIRFEKIDPFSGVILDSIFSQYTGRRPLVPSYQVLVDGRIQTAALPTEIVVTFWRGEDCQSPLDWERSLLTARRRVSYHSAEVYHWRHSPTEAILGLSFRWEKGAFDIATRRNVSVEDLRGACFYVDLEGDSMAMMYGPTGHLWDAANVIIHQFEFPYGRRALIRPYSRMSLVNGPEVTRLPSDF